MASITIRNLEDEIKQRLRVRAAEHGRSMEEEVRDILRRAGWVEMLQIREEASFTKGRIMVRGKLVSRGQAKRADYVLYFKPNIPLALIEAVDFVFIGDGCAAWCHEILTWFDAFDTGRVHARLANMMDPATQVTPYPAGGNPKPNSPDKRLGDGSFGDASIVSGFGTYPKTANAGTDFVWSRDEIFRPSRGSYHQSNIGHIRLGRHRSGKLGDSIGAGDRLKAEGPGRDSRPFCFYCNARCDYVSLYEANQYSAPDSRTTRHSCREARASRRACRHPPTSQP